MISINLKSIIDLYIDRIYHFYDYSPDKLSELKDSLRHIEIIRRQIESDVIHMRSTLSEEDDQFIHSILKDSEYFESKFYESEKWRVNMLRLTWNRLIEIMEYSPIDSSKVEIEKNAYVDTKSRKDGRHVYEKYKGN